MPDDDDQLRLFDPPPMIPPPPIPERRTVIDKYPYTRADGAAVARPLFQVEDGGSIPTSALHLTFELVGLNTACSLNALWHSVLPNLAPAAVGMGRLKPQCYVAEHDDYWYAVAIWSTPLARTFADGTVIELRRLAIAPTAPKNTASRMLSFMARDLRKRLPELKLCVSYQAVDHHAGTIYKAAGWTPTRFSKHANWHPFPGMRTAAAPSRKIGTVAQMESGTVRWELNL